ncbi:MAG TPA: hypothetical protein VKV24_00535 [Casimicrobiaceae bacterium]|nr:hypothetical protein [Casimicrobiaceae bacterium]
MSLQHRLRPRDRTLAVLLALIWLGAGAAGLVFGVSAERWLPAIAGTLAIVYGVLWVRVAARGRLLRR